MFFAVYIFIAFVFLFSSLNRVNQTTFLVSLITSLFWPICVVLRLIVKGHPFYTGTLMEALLGMEDFQIIKYIVTNEYNIPCEYFDFCVKKKRKEIMRAAVHISKLHGYEHLDMPRRISLAMFCRFFQESLGITTFFGQAGTERILEQFKANNISAEESYNLIYDKIPNEKIDSRVVELLRNREISRIFSLI